MHWQFLGPLGGMWHAIWQVRTWPLLVLHVLIAGTVTVHVLLTKRDIGSAVGWIGLGWLSPLAGGGLYFLLGINRVHRRARRLRDRLPGVHPPEQPFTLTQRNDALAPLERGAHQISRRPATLGNAVTILRNGDEAYPRMIAAIQAARVSVMLSSYILRDDKAGGPFLDALIQAHARGVAVRVLVDGIGSGYFVSGAFRRLRGAGVPVARFMHSSKPWLMPFLNLRTHKKLLVVDGLSAFTGGLNIGQENVLALRPRHPVRDMHFAVEGPVVGQLTDAFAQDWLFTTHETLSGETWFPDLSPCGPYIARVVTSGPDREVERIEYLALLAVTCARSSIQIMTPYFLPDERIVTALTLAALRGVEVDVVIPRRSNQPLVDAATRPNITPLIHAGCRIWHNPPPFEHSKLMVVDSAWALVGSTNWDMRSFRLNFELNLEVTQGDLATTLSAYIAEKCADRVTAAELVRRWLPVRLRDAAVRLLLPYL